MLGGFARVDRAAKHLAFRWLHCCTFPGSREERMPGPPRRKRGAEGSSRVVTGSSPGSRNPRFGCTPKKRGPLQAVPGNRPRNGREALVRAVAPGETIRRNRHGVALVLIFAHEHRAGLEAPGALGSALVAMSAAVQELHGAWIVDRWDRVQLVNKEGCRVARKRRSQGSRDTQREKMSLPGRWRW
jgi:hypothetical protein